MKEVSCVVRGIYHSPMFVKWVSLQLASNDGRLNTSRVKKAVTARFTMCNNPSRITSSTPSEELPYCIWYPHLADPKTYIHLARRRRPDMQIQAARACIVADYAATYRDINPPFDRVLAREADTSPTPSTLWTCSARPALSRCGTMATTWTQPKHTSSRGSIGPSSAPGRMCRQGQERSGALNVAQSTRAKTMYTMGLRRILTKSKLLFARRRNRGRC